MKIGDRVQLQDSVAAMMARNRLGHGKYATAWRTRTGTVLKLGNNSGYQQVSSVGVKWDGRTSLDWWSPRSLRVL